MKRPIDDTFEGVEGWGDDASEPCAAKSGNKCHSDQADKCCTEVEGVWRDTGGLVNTLWNLTSIFDENDWAMVFAQQPVSGARPLGLMDTSFASPTTPWGS